VDVVPVQSDAIVMTLRVVRGTGVVAMWVATCVAAWLAPASAMAQQDVTGWQPEARVEALAARTTAWQLAAGANVPMGTYVRTGLLAAAGVRRVRGAWNASARVDAVARFHIDPFRESPYGLYVGGGGSYLFDKGVPSRPRLTVVLGYEGRASKHRVITGAELGLGGGVRIAVTIRRARASAR
jgi:hypothetical protein